MMLMTCRLLLLSKRQRYNTIFTPVIGGPIVNEYISRGSYKISIKGLIVNNDSFTEPPEEALYKFRKFTDLAGVPIAIESNWLNILGICEVVITGKTLNQMEGYSHVFAYTIELSSVTPLNLRLREGI
jgi:Domain of unknown function (DUF6046)